MTDLPSIPTFFAGKSVFVTGGSGFLGKVLVEKLLRSCPDLKNIYLLMREKRGRRLAERLQQITDTPLFDLLKTQQPASIAKIKPINGDVAELGLGLSPDDRRLLIEDVGAVFHAAASVRFDDTLKHAVLLNTRGTREVCQLALEMRELQVFVHVSTTYCHTDHKIVEERLYPPHADWRKTIEVAEKTDEDLLKVLTSKYIEPFINTYCFTKSLAEHVVYDLCVGRIPAVVFRPSIVISTALEPVIGWIDNINGPVGLLLGSGKGVVRTAYCDVSIQADYVPVDIIIKALLISAWKQATFKDAEKLTPTFYNASNNNINPITVGEMTDMGLELCNEIPFNDILWYPSSRPAKCYYHYLINVIVHHLIPAIIIDNILKVAGRKPMLLKLQRRIFVANMALGYFSHNEWTFLNNKTFALQNELVQSDWDDFNYREKELTSREYLKNATIGARKYLLKETDDTFDRAKTHMSRMWAVAKIATVLWYLVLFWVVFYKIDIVALIGRKLTDIHLFFTTD